MSEEDPAPLFVGPRGDCGGKMRSEVMERKELRATPTPPALRARVGRTVGLSSGSGWSEQCCSGPRASRLDAPSFTCKGFCFLFFKTKQNKKTSKCN